MGMTVLLLLAAGLVIGVSTLPGQQSSNASTAANISAPPSSLGAPSPGPVGAAAQATADDPETGVSEPFIQCSPDYADGPGAELDRNNVIGPENSIIVSPEEMKAMGLPETQIQAQTVKWNQLSAEEREEQLCRAAQQRAVLGQ